MEEVRVRGGRLERGMGACLFFLVVLDRFNTFYKLFHTITTTTIKVRHYTSVSYVAMISTTQDPFICYSINHPTYLPHGPYQKSSWTKRMRIFAGTKVYVSGRYVKHTARGIGPATAPLPLLLVYVLRTRVPAHLS